MSIIERKMQYFIDEIIFNYELRSEYKTCMNYHREAFLEPYTEIGNSTAIEYSLECILSLLMVNQEIRKYNQYVAKSSGVQEAYFEDIFYGDACEYVDSGIRDECRSFLFGSFANVRCFFLY